MVRPVIGRPSRDMIREAVSSSGTTAAKTSMAMSPSLTTRLVSPLPSRNVRCATSRSATGDHVANMR